MQYLIVCFQCRFVYRVIRCCVCNVVATMKTAFNSLVNVRVIHWHNMQKFMLCFLDVNILMTYQERHFNCFLFALLYSWISSWILLLSCTSPLVFELNVDSCLNCTSERELLDNSPMDYKICLTISSGTPVCSCFLSSLL